MPRFGEATTSQTWRTLKFNIATIMGMGLSGCANMGSTSEALTVLRRRLSSL